MVQLLTVVPASNIPKRIAQIAQFSSYSSEQIGKPNPYFRTQPLTAVDALVSMSRITSGNYGYGCSAYSNTDPAQVVND